MLNTEQKEKIIKKFRSHTSDTGSSKVQIAIITEEIKKLSAHLKKHRKDTHSRRGLLKMVAKRKKMMDFLKKNEPSVYKGLIADLGIKKKGLKKKMEADKADKKDK